MSDTFDHGCDAAESTEWDDRDDLGDGGDLFIPRLQARRRHARPEGEGMCPVCGGHMHLVRTGRFGPFWGCNKYPACKGTRDGSAADKAMVKTDDLLYETALAKIKQRQSQTQAKKGT